MDSEKRERNRAVRIAYGHARRGAIVLAESWFEVAEKFATVAPTQRARLDELVAAGASTIPGQIDIYGKELH